MAILKILCIAVLALPAVVIAVPADEGRVRAGDPVVYVGAVMEYEPYHEWTEEGEEGITQENAVIFAEYAAEAKAKGADILVTPEAGLQSVFGGSEGIFPRTQYVPDPELHVVPCGMEGDGPNFKALRTLSCAALVNQLYMVVDLAESSPCNQEAAALNPFDNALDTAYECSSDGRNYYNTQVVFDRNGTVIARYRKKNLYLEPHFNPGLESDETAIFVTDFGVTFTLQICFDIAFMHPGVSNVMNHGVRDVAMSTSWVDILPFFLALSVQNGWSRSLGVNLLVSGYHLPEMAKLGSGIYRGFTDLESAYVYDPDSGNRMIVSEVSTIATANGVQRAKHQDNTVMTSEAAGLAEDNALVDKQPRREHLMYYDDISSYTHLFLAPSASGESQVVNLCHQDEICCSLTYTSTSNLNYSLLAYSGPMLQGGGSYVMYIEVCAVVWCKAEDINTCSRVSDDIPSNDNFYIDNINGNFSAEHVFPIALTRNLTLVDNALYSVTIDGNKHSLTTWVETRNIMSVGFVSRRYDLDPSEESSDDLLSYVFQLAISLFVRLWKNLFE